MIIIKKSFLFIIILTSLLSCNEKTILERSFEIEKQNIMYGGMIVSAVPFQIEGMYESRYIREKGGIGGINLAKPELDKLYCDSCNVTDSTKAILIINFPLKKIIGYEITNENGFNKKDIVIELSKAYTEVYAEKEKYDICCDEFSDLELKSVLVFKVGQEIYLESHVDSKK